MNEADLSERKRGPQPDLGRVGGEVPGVVEARLQPELLLPGRSIHRPVDPDADDMDASRLSKHFARRRAVLFGKVLRKLVDLLVE